SRQNAVAHISAELAGPACGRLAVRTQYGMGNGLRRNEGVRNDTAEQVCFRGEPQLPRSFQADYGVAGHEISRFGRRACGIEAATVSDSEESRDTARKFLMDCLFMLWLARTRG